MSGRHASSGFVVLRVSARPLSESWDAQEGDQAAWAREPELQCADTLDACSGARVRREL